MEDGEKRVENVKVIILKKNGDCYESFEAYEEVVQDGDIYKTITHPTTITIFIFINQTVPSNER